jgi:prevent-host-death family protein
VGNEFGKFELLKTLGEYVLKYISEYVFKKEPDMQKIIGVTELQRKFRPLFDSVVHNRTPLILTRGSRPEAVLIPYEDYLRYQQLQESEVLARFDKVWERLAQVNAEFSEDEIAADIKAARQG